MPRNLLTNAQSTSLWKLSLAFTSLDIRSLSNISDSGVSLYNESRSPTTRANATVANEPAMAYNTTRYFTTDFNPSMAIIIVALLIAFFSMAILTIHITRRDTDGTRRRGTRTYQNAAGGLDRTLVDKLPIVTYSVPSSQIDEKGPMECVVCLSEFQEKETLRLLPKCGHLFHQECIDMWLYSHITCPLCRCNVVTEEEGSVHEIVNANAASANTADREAILVSDDNGVHLPGHGNSTTGGEIMIAIPDGEATSDTRSFQFWTEDDGQCETILHGDSPIYGILIDSSLGPTRTRKLRRSHSTGHSLFLKTKNDIRAVQSSNQPVPVRLPLLTFDMHRSKSYTALSGEWAARESSTFNDDCRPDSPQRAPIDSSKSDVCKEISKGWRSFSLKRAFDRKKTVLR